MIMNQDIKPEKQAYYLGAQIIEVVKNQKLPQGAKVDVFEIFSQLNLNASAKVSDHAFAMGMNWLFLLGVLKVDGEDIKLCF